MSQGTLAWAVPLAIVANGALACSISPVSLADRLLNHRVRQADDCSFVNGGIYDNEQGAAAVDEGNGRVSQMLSRDAAILVDCGTGESLTVIGKADPEGDDSCGPYYELGRYLAPDGPLDLAAGSSLAEFATIASAMQIETRPDATRNYRHEAQKDRVDIFCGCRRFYKGSPGAALR